MSNLDAVTEAGNRVRDLEKGLADAVAERDAAVRTAVRIERKAAVAKAAGLSRQRVDQIVAAA